MALDAQRNWDASMADNLHSMTIQLPPAPRSAIIDIQRKVQPWNGPPIHLPIEVLVQIISCIATEKESRTVHPLTKQRDIHACSLLSRSWNHAATPALYARPILFGAKYDLFTRTICPSINLFIRRSAVASFVRELDLSSLIHQGSKSTTARLLGRTKDSLRIFVAPQASFSLNCFPALSKCHQLTVLDLSLVSEAASLRTLFDTVAGLEHLLELRLPRSSGFGTSIDPSAIIWPRKLQSLFLSGGLQSSFWRGEFHLPPFLSKVSVAHCPKMMGTDLTVFLSALALFDKTIRHANREASTRTATEPPLAKGLYTRHAREAQDLFPPARHQISHVPSPRGIESLTLSNLPALAPQQAVLYFLPHLAQLSISADYCVPDLLDPQSTFQGGDVIHDISTLRGGRDLYIPPGDLADDDDELNLRVFELTDSGNPGDLDKFTPIDILIAADPVEGSVKKLRCVRVKKSLGWARPDDDPDSDAVNDLLLENAARENYTGSDKGLFIIQ